MFLEELTTNQKVYDAVIYGIVDKTYKLDNNKVSYMPGQGNGQPTNYLDWPGQWGFWRKEFQKYDDQHTEKYYATYDAFINRPNQITSTVATLFPTRAGSKQKQPNGNSCAAKWAYCLCAGLTSRT